MESYSLIILGIVLAITAPSSCYDSKYDSFNVDNVFANNAEMSYIDCFLDKNDCSAEGASDFKNILSDVVKTSCASCTEKQAENIRKGMLAIKQKHPDQWAELTAKYDPKGEYTPKFSQWLNGSK